MNLEDYTKVTVADLLQGYQEKLEKGIDEPYINRCDLVKVWSKEDLDLDKVEKEAVAYQVAGQILTVVANCKVAEDLWYWTVVDENNKEYILYDAEIEHVYKLNDKCKRCMDCVCLECSDDTRYYCASYDKLCSDIDICHELRAEYFDELADEYDLEEDEVEDIVRENFNKDDLDDLSENEYDKLISILEAR